MPDYNFDDLKIKSNNDILDKDRWNGFLDKMAQETVPLIGDADIAGGLNIVGKVVIGTDSANTAHPLDVVAPKWGGLLISSKSKDAGTSIRLFTQRHDFNKDFWGGSPGGTSGSGNKGWVIETYHTEFSDDNIREDLRIDYHDDERWHTGIRVKKEGMKLGIGTIHPKGKVHIYNKNEDAGGGALIIGPTSQSNLRLGYHSDYSWIQSHAGKPLCINPKGNNVGIGTVAPKVSLDVKGAIKATGFTYTSNKNERLIHFKRFKNLGDAVTKKTTYKTSDWNAAIVGFYAADGDIQESGTGSIIHVRMSGKSGYWHIIADFKSHRNHENWLVDVMFVRKEISKRSGY